TLQFVMVEVPKLYVMNPDTDVPSAKVTPVRFQVLVWAAAKDAEKITAAREPIARTRAMDRLLDLMESLLSPLRDTRRAAGAYHRRQAGIRRSPGMRQAGILGPATTPAGGRTP